MARPDPHLWDQPDMWNALARRDIGTVYRLLRVHGMTQAEIAALTGQTPSEVSAIMSGRQVMAYDLLERIANALGIPRGRLGLSYEPGAECGNSTPLDDDAERTRILAHAAKVVLGRPAFGEPADMPHIVEDTPPPHRAGKADVEQILRLTAEFAELERRSGGGLVLPALTAQLRRCRAVLAAPASDEVSRELLVAVALLHRRASCAAFDLGLLDVARRHVLRALELAHMRHSGPRCRPASYTALGEWSCITARPTLR